MKKLLQLIKKAAVDAVEARKPCDVMFATVEKTEPVAVKIENSLTIPSELLVFTDGAKQNMSAGCRVILLRKSGGQQYVVLGVAV